MNTYKNSKNWDVIGISEMRRPKECFTTLQSSHLYYHSKANNGQAGVTFLINRKWKDPIVKVNNISRSVAELVLFITKCYKLKIVQVYAPTTKPLHNSDGRFQCSHWEKNKPYGNGNGQIWAEIGF